MVTRQQLEGQWNQVKGRLKERWGQLTDDELDQVEGNARQLVGAIQQKTGESRQAIEDFLEEVLAEGASTISKMAESAREYASKAGEYASRASQSLHENYDRASEALHDQYDRASESVRGQYDRAAECVRKKPAESIGVAFGAGIITGVVVGLLLRGRNA